MLKKAFRAVSGGLLMVSVAAHAALPADVTTAITTAETDIVALITALTSAGVVVWVASVIYGRFRVR